MTRKVKETVASPSFGFNKFEPGMITAKSCQTNQIQSLQGLAVPAGYLLSHSVLKGGMDTCEYGKVSPARCMDCSRIVRYLFRIEFGRGEYPG